MDKLDIAVVPGDGVGSEVMAEGLKVLRTVARIHGGLEFRLREAALFGFEFEVLIRVNLDLGNFIAEPRTASGVKASSHRNQFTDDDIFLQAAQIINLTSNCRTNQNLAGFLERCS